MSTKYQFFTFCFGGGGLQPSSLHPSPSCVCNATWYRFCYW